MSRALRVYTRNFYRRGNDYPKSRGQEEQAESKAINPYLLLGTPSSERTRRRKIRAIAPIVSDSQRPKSFADFADVKFARPSSYATFARDFGKCIFIYTRCGYRNTATNVQLDTTRLQPSCVSVIYEYAESAISHHRSAVSKNTSRYF